MTVMAAHQWKTNGDMIADVARLGYLREDWPTLDPTYGLGTWWTVFRPRELHMYDLVAKAQGVRVADFRNLPYPAGAFRAVAFDPPYKLNGTPTADVDERYGVHVVRSREERHQLMLDGLAECARVLAPGGFLLAKCKDQVEGGKVRWQTDMMTERAEDLGLVKVDALHFLGYRPQPAGRRQEHARRNYSTLLVLQAPRTRPRRTEAML